MSDQSSVERYIDAQTFNQRRTRAMTCKNVGVTGKYPKGRTEPKNINSADRALPEKSEEDANSSG